MIKVFRYLQVPEETRWELGQKWYLVPFLVGLLIIVIYTIRGLPQTLQEKLFQLGHKCTFQIFYAVLLHNVPRIPVATRHTEGIQ